jgi:hypothetical protein
MPRGAEAVRWHEEAEAGQSEGAEAAARGGAPGDGERREGTDPLSHIAARAATLSHTAAWVVALSHAARLGRTLAQGSSSGAVTRGIGNR